MIAIFHRLCLRVKSTQTFVKVLNELLEYGCYVHDAELDKDVMNIMIKYCREKAGRPKSEYIKKAAECLGRQPNSSTWVFSCVM